jgi:ADP-ribose pyrophosphatase YjhB (NUDIX family)
MNKPVNAPTDVVTCFVMKKGADGRDVVLLVKRSDQVRTYRGHWAAISGYLEQGVAPLEQVREELREELGLTEEDALLVKAGEPLTFTDSAIGITWTVHPFLFRLREGSQIHTDWEASATHWMTPAEINTLQTVPMLREALARVYP